MELILKNINKTPKKLENAMMMEISKWDNEKVFFKKWLSIRQICVSENYLTLFSKTFEYTLNDTRICVWNIFYYPFEANTPRHI